jgi:hypothetical protein
MRKPPYKIFIASLIVILTSCNMNKPLTSGRYVTDKVLLIAAIDIDMNTMTARIYPNMTTSPPDSIPDFPYKEAQIEKRYGSYYLVKINSDAPPREGFERVKIEVLNENDILVDCAMISQILCYRDFCRGEELVMHRVD